MTDAAAPTSDSGPLTSSASPAARFATFSSRVQGVSADAYRDYARRFGHPGASHGVMTLAHPHSAQAVTGALVALKAKCDAAEAERDEWRSKCADAERARDAATAASERATRDATEATTRANASRDAAESRAVADAESARRAAATANARAERAEADLARVNPPTRRASPPPSPAIPPGSPPNSQPLEPNTRPASANSKPRGPRDAKKPSDAPPPTRTPARTPPRRECAS